MSIKYQRRSREEWQQVMEQFQASGQSGAAFCKAQSIPYASFSQWKQALLARPPASPSTGSAFIDLQTLVGTGNTWKIVLRLGADIELVLSQP